MDCNFATRPGVLQRCVGIGGPMRFTYSPCGPESLRNAGLWTGLQLHSERCTMPQHPDPEFHTLRGDAQKPWPNLPPQTRILPTQWAGYPAIHIVTLGGMVSVCLNRYR